jgi:hypothetical protein
VRFEHFTAPEDGPALLHRWGDSIPLVRLSFASPLVPAEWESVDGPHLDRLAELSFDRLPPETIRSVVSSPLVALTRLSVNAVGSDPEAIRSLVASPPWPGLRQLRFTGRLWPDGVRALAIACNLEKLENLDLTLGDPADALGEVLSSIIQLFIRMISLSAAGLTRWAEFGPALEALAAAAWVCRLRRLAIRAPIPLAFRGLFAERVADTIPDTAVLALAAALDRDKLTRWYCRARWSVRPSGAS